MKAGAIGRLGNVTKLLQRQRRDSQCDFVNGGGAFPAISEELQSRPKNFGVHTAWRKAKERDTWHQVVSTATLC